MIYKQEGYHCQSEKLGELVELAEKAHRLTLNRQESLSQRNICEVNFNARLCSQPFFYVFFLVYIRL